MNKTKITFYVPEILQHELQARVIKEGYGLRGKSRWVSEAISRLLIINNFPELVNYSDSMGGFEKAETIVIDQATQHALENAIIQIRKNFPLLEGVKSRIIRTALLQRLLRS
jgi:hypothetical protein